MKQPTNYQFPVNIAEVSHIDFRIIFRVKFQEFFAKSSAPWPGQLVAKSGHLILFAMRVLGWQGP